ncbi:major facilitator superfamily domain-containing protein 12-like isoform X2 [Actinia tenebrosa]|uniref:Major facilitator superfamily domain-containing protein 12-like isoform X2 n=1 Tax=Actinia tenebrosa TaxID=6105 RepID=A0A6P8HFQ0_ACTTE|nr:major facilitator superfamily domain-containing protein 12-like isoform X2 [Actinia tenebrosa]
MASLSTLTWRTKLCYGVGHILNDLTASAWFTYLLVYLQKVVKFSGIEAGVLLLIGQVADAIATPLVGIESDRLERCSYGRRKIWHLVGVICVVISFPFIFNLCVGCSNPSHMAMFIYYAPFIVVFQFGWAATQISHLSLIPELITNDQEKCDLNAIRYAATVASNIFVFIITWIMLDSGKEASDPNQLSTSDATAFMYVVFIVVGVGLFFVTIFHIGVKERPRDASHEFATKSSRRSASNWVMWFKVPLFYQTAIMYMCVRLIVNITQVYIPMYTLETLHLTKDKIAIMPLIVYVSGFVSTFLSKPLNKYIGRKGVFLCGLITIFAVCIWMWFLPPRNAQVYGVSVLIGVGGSTLLVTALTMLADLIGENVETGAFVYGAMSFMDKMSNGIVVQIIQALYPKKPNAGGFYYKQIMVFVAGTAALVALITLLTTLRKKSTDHIIQGSGQKSISTDDERQCLLPSSSEHSLTTSLGYSWSLLHLKGPLTPYEPFISHSQPENTDETIQLNSGRQHQDYSVNESRSIAS